MSVGDLKQFEELFDKNYHHLCNKVCRITRDMASAEDIVQDVFVDFWMKEQQQKTQKHEAYLYKSCINRALSLVSSLKRKETLNTLYSDSNLLKSSSTDHELEFNELEQKVKQSIDSLPPMCKKVFLLSRYEEMSHKEIADFLKISPNTVDNHIKKALVILRKALLSIFLLMPKYFSSFYL